MIHDSWSSGFELMMLKQIQFHRKSRDFVSEARFEYDLTSQNGVGSLYHIPAYDNNGNVVAYFDETGAFAARYDYDAFGNTIASSGPLADTLPHRFSTKYFDPDLGLYYYGCRWYSPELGRWISRDPIQEIGGMNLFSCCKNSPLLAVDFLGLKPGMSILEFHPDSSQNIPWSLKELDENTGGQTYPDYKIKCCKICWETGPSKRKMYEIACHIYVIQNVFLNSRPNLFTQDGSYGHEKKHVDAFIQDVKSTVGPKLENIDSYERENDSISDKKLGEYENDLLTLLKEAHTRGENHMDPHPKAGAEFDPNGSRPLHPISPEQRLILPETLSCDVFR